MTKRVTVVVARLRPLVAWPGTRRASSEAGATAVEYSVMVGLVATIIIGAVVALGSAVSDNLCAPVAELRANAVAAEGCEEPAGE